MPRGPASSRRATSSGDAFERNLHDGAQQRLVSAALMLRVAKTRLDSNSPPARPSCSSASAELDGGLEELRELARGLHPGTLTDHGPARPSGAGRSAAARRHLDVPEERLPEHLEATAYYIASEALTNVVKHAHASGATVTVTRLGSIWRLEVRDNGRGGADPGAGSGILGLRDRAEAVGGTLSFVSPPRRHDGHRRC